MSPAIDLAQICAQFQFDGEFVEAVPYGGGHIHDTFAARVRLRDGAMRRYLLQRINRRVFPDPGLVMRNLERVTGHLRRKIAAAGGDPQRGTLTLVPALDGRPFHCSADGETWRAEIFIEGAATCRSAGGQEQYFQAARAFGRFQRDLADLPVHELEIPLPDFHHTGRRFEQFSAALGRDRLGRAASATAEIDFASRHAGDVGRLVDLAAAGKIPERATHNDAKLDNVLLDDASGEGICVLDLDTVMPGLAAFDFGDLVRSGAGPAAEDETDLSRVSLDLQVYEQIARGFLEAARAALTPAEIDSLPFAAFLITFEQGLRFLTDHLEGDRYYKIGRPGHNLDRCRTQFKLAAEMEARSDAMTKILEKYR